METKTVFVVYSPYYEDVNDIYGVFDSKERMDEFLYRFKDRADDFEIREMALNPQFPGDKSRNPYCAPFYSDGRANLFIVYDPTETEKAMNNVHEVDELDGVPNCLTVYLLAETKDEARTEAIARMEKMVEKGAFTLTGELDMED